MRTEKTGTPVTIPLLPELAEIIAVSKTGDLAFIATVTGTPMTKESFGNWFRDACKAAGVPGSAHGLRKAGATRAANNGATVRWRYGFALHASSRPDAACKRGYGKVIEGEN